VGTSVDIATVHFCHAYYQKHVRLPRAARPTPWHNANERLFSRMALMAEERMYRCPRELRLAPVSEGLASQLLEMYPETEGRITTIHNAPSHAANSDEAVPLSRHELGVVDDGDLVALFAGGDWHRKGAAVAVRALQAAPRWRLVVAGHGDESGLLKIASEVGVADRVELVGFRRDLGRWYAAADAFVLPTAYEAGPLVAYEAAAAGLPIVACRVSGISDLLDAGAGLEVSRDPADVARALGVLEDVEVRRTLARTGRAAASQFTWRSAAERYAMLYRQLTSGV
jgi:UDP-glucose:(heptosyl)LPS alpha-1,3-glucosyltransferase